MNESLTELQEALVVLDVALTGAKRYVAETAAFQRRVDVVGLFSDLYYLSDGGYSRIGAYDVGVGLFLCLGAQKKVVDRWEECKPERDAVERALKKELENIECDCSQGW